MKKLLTDEQMRSFLTQGFLVLKADLPREAHLDIRNRCFEALEKSHGNPGNNILPLVPELQQVYDSPVVSGALTSVLGSRYIMHPHRHMHANANSAGGGWHKDSYWGYTNRVRNHRPWWVMIMYYPQDVVPADGPTGVVPGSHCHEKLDADLREQSTTVTGEAGTCFLIHYDIWHCATRNTSGVNRQMCKFEFMRLDTPDVTGSPAWDSQESDWREPAQLPLLPHRGMWRQSWNFLRGKPASAHTRAEEVNGRSINALTAADPRARMTAADELERCGPAAIAALPQLTTLLGDDYEPACINAAYAIAAIGAPAIPALIQALQSENARASLSAAYALAAMNTSAIPALLDSITSSSALTRTHAAFALGEISGTNGDVIGALARALRDGESRVRLHAVEALGMKGGAAKNALPALIESLRDANTEVRFNAVLTCARLGTVAAEAVAPLKAALSDPDRYVRGYAVEALHQIGTKEAYEAVIPFLKTARWCTSTSTASNF
jgi:HEAT repeat protein